MVGVNSHERIDGGLAVLLAPRTKFATGKILCAQRQRLSSGGILIASKAVSQDAGGLCPGLAGMEGISKADEGDLRSRGLH